MPLDPARANWAPASATKRSCRLGRADSTSPRTRARRTLHTDRVIQGHRAAAAVQQRCGIRRRRRRPFVLVTTPAALIDTTAAVRHRWRHHGPRDGQRLHIHTIESRWWCGGSRTTSNARVACLTHCQAGHAKGTHKNAPTPANRENAKLPHAPDTMPVSERGRASGTAPTTDGALISPCAIMQQLGSSGL